jgi:hypothetical protein
VLAILDQMHVLIRVIYSSYCSNQDPRHHRANGTAMTVGTQMIVIMIAALQAVLA